MSAVGKLVYLDLASGPAGKVTEEGEVSIVIDLAEPLAIAIETIAGSVIDPGDPALVANEAQQEAYEFSRWRGRGAKLKEFQRQGISSEIVAAALRAGALVARKIGGES